MQLSTVRKLLLNILGTAALILTVALGIGGLIPLAYLPYAMLVIGVAQAYGVWRVPNAPAVRRDHTK